MRVRSLEKSENRREMDCPLTDLFANYKYYKVYYYEGKIILLCLQSEDDVESLFDEAGPKIT